ncbi:hypothetical protein FAF44_53400, partial [Nonomuraea sp. MG754425]|nr:hypothetical protein [Nonomuraea sp. MG754425]
ISQAWNAGVTQNGGTVTASDAGWNGSLATGAGTSFGFNGTWNNAANPVPAPVAREPFQPASEAVTVPPFCVTPAFHAWLI